MKNISKTLAERQQMRASSVFYSGMFSSDAVILPHDVTYKKNVESDTPFGGELKQFMSDDDLLTKEVTVDGQKYVNGDLVVIKVEDCDKLRVGLVQSILVRRGKVFLVCRVYSCSRNWLQFFESNDCDDISLFVESRSLADYKPLIKRGTTIKFQFVLHHRVSFSYND